VVTAFIVRRDPTLTDEQVTDFCRSTTTLAAFKRPRRIHFVDEIPKSPVGKVQRRVLQERYAPGRAPQR
jgi:acyl-CoA synthetase (AMP-forming)/AMP-acid ligase II